MFLSFFHAWPLFPLLFSYNILLSDCHMYIMLLNVAEYRKGHCIYSTLLEWILDRGTPRCSVVGYRTGFATLEQFSSDNGEGVLRWTGIEIEHCHAVSAAVFPDAFGDGGDQDHGVVFVNLPSLDDGYASLDGCLLAQRRSQQL